MEWFLIYFLVALLIVQYIAEEHRSSKRDRQHLREREALTNKIMHLAGRTWEEPPSAKAWEPEEVPNYTVSPEQDLDLVP